MKVSLTKISYTVITIILNPWKHGSRCAGMLYYGNMHIKVQLKQTLQFPPKMSPVKMLHENILTTSRMVLIV